MRQLNRNRALVLFSGGQDSSIALAWALQQYDSVETIGFSYGQRQKVELDARQNVRQILIQHDPDWKQRLGPDHIVDLAGFGEISETALTRDTEIVMTEAGLPNTFVPGRNLVFLSVAAGLAYRRDIAVLVAGMCEEDATGYPDCRADTLKAQLGALRLGLDADMRLETPVLHITKAQSWAFAQTLGGTRLVDAIRIHSHTCYKGVRDVHAWGAGCGACPACQLRAEGWQAYVSALSPMDLD